MRDETEAEMPLMLDQTEKDVRDLLSAADTQVDGRGAIAAAAALQWEDVGVAAPAEGRAHSDGGAATMDAWMHPCIHASMHPCMASMH